MFGENQGGLAGQPLLGHDDPYMGITWIGAESFPVMHALSTSSDAGIEQFSTNHPGVVHFGLADGSARGLNESIEDNTLRNLAGMADRQVTGNY